MDIDGLRTFVAIAELGGFTRAAARLHRSQPAISRRLGLLEQELGVPLFDRLRGRARLTEAGAAFRPHAEAALAALKDGQEAVRDLQSGLSGSLSLALVGTLADTHIVDTLRRFRERAPGVRLELRTASSAEVTDLVRRGEVTLGLRYFFPDRADLAIHAAGAEAMLVVAAAGHPSAGRRVRKVGTLSGERWIGFPPVRNERDSSGHLLARLLLRAGLDDADVTLIDSLTAQKRLAQAGFGLALVPESSVRDELRQGLLVALDVPALRAVNPITAIHRRNAYLSPAAKALLALLTGRPLKPKRLASVSSPSPAASPATASPSRRRGPRGTPSAR
ncbi:LysR family transcriptional regulator [Reyranella sp.]|uniref:LysR family transcriptional regulator n=1 Tax=Reyranella sp. TaxID=1929291 RepID=UPI003BA88217